MKVKYLGTYYEGTAFDKDKVYEVLSIEKGWYRIMTELDEDYLFPPECFEILEGEKSDAGDAVTPKQKSPARV